MATVYVTLKNKETGNIVTVHRIDAKDYNMEKYEIVEGSIERETVKPSNMLAIVQAGQEDKNAELIKAAQDAESKALAKAAKAAEKAARAAKAE